MIETSWAGGSKVEAISILSLLITKVLDSIRWRPYATSVLGNFISSSIRSTGTTVHCPPSSRIRHGPLCICLSPLWACFPSHSYLRMTLITLVDLQLVVDNRCMCRPKDRSGVSIRFQQWNDLDAQRMVWNDFHATRFLRLDHHHQVQASTCRHNRGIGLQSHHPLVKVTRDNLVWIDFVLI